MRTAIRLAVRRTLPLVIAAAILVTADLAFASGWPTSIRLGRTTFGPPSAPYIALRLQNGHHYAIYMSTRDPRDKSRCSNSCADTFKPVISRGRVKAMDGVRQQLLGVINHGHGVWQVTYNHHPLYTATGPAANDTPGIALDDGCRLFGATWYVLKKDGNPDRRLSCQGY